MLFNSYEFCLLFLPATLLIFGLSCRLPSRAFALAWLAIASLVFYAWSSPSGLLLLGCSIGLNYGVGRGIESLATRDPARARRLAGLGVGANLLILGLAKYLEFFVEIGASLAGVDLPLTRAVPPLAISFFTFQQIAYLVDVRRGEAAEHNLLRYGLFVCFFPQLIAGPIVHHKEVLPQFEGMRLGLSPVSLARGLPLFAIGLAKKVVVADGIVGWVEPVFAAAGSSPLGFADAWAGALAFALQLYFDFSGYCDMAIGLGAMFGVRLPVNFDSPYRADSVIDFWRRWHITLSRFLRDYLYIPLGGNRRGRARRYANLLLTMLLGGLWHGANWTFVVWGGLHGVYLVINHAWRWLWQSTGRALPSGMAYRAACRGLTLLAVVIAWVFFRADSLTAAWTLLRAMAGDAGGAPASPALFDAPQLAVLALLLALVSFAPNSQQIVEYHEFSTGGADRSRARRGSPQPVAGPRFAPTLPWAAVTAALLLASLAGMSNAREFVYFRF